MTEHCGDNQSLLTFLRDALGITIPEKIAGFILDPANPHARYDLLGVLKSAFIGRIFIQPGDDECLSVRDAVAFGNRIGAIPVYAYLGDVGESPTGDKKAEKFEDDFLDELVPELSRSVLKALPTCRRVIRANNSPASKRYVDNMAYLKSVALILIVRAQAFTCPILLDPQFRHLLDATWALFAHERLGNYDASYGSFSPDNPLANISLDERVAAYAHIGQHIDPWQPDNVSHLLPQS